MDVANAFLQGDLEEEVYMTIPQGFNTEGENKVCRLKKSLYGLKKASRQWNTKLTEALMNGGFVRSKHDYSLFYKTIGSETVLILIYVDDLLITGSTEATITEVKEYLHDCFNIRDLGIMKFFLGIEIARSRKGMFLAQRKYILELLQDLGMSGCKPLNVPIAQGCKLIAFEAGKHKESDLMLKPERYRNLVGRLIYLTITRPDICFVVQVLSQFMHNPMKEHMVAGLNVVRYLKGSIGLGILIKPECNLTVDCFCDADWVAYRTTRRSVTGYLLKLGGTLI